MKKEELGIYIHIPFCMQKCLYCDFVSYINKSECVKEYINCMIKEIQSYDFKKYNISYIYGIAKVLKSQDEIDKIRLHGNFVLCSVL